jgi:23S rRNA pseudouridine2605 synthase
MQSRPESLQYLKYMNDKERPLKTLERVLSKAGVGSRTEARKWIAEGRVTVNGRRIQTADHWVDMARDKVKFDGKLVRAREKLHLLLNKPSGYVTSYGDPEGRPTVYDLLPKGQPFLANVGRLDMDTSGLLIFTNDTQFANFVTSPESHVPKTYLVKTATLLSEEQLDQFRKGVELDDGPTRPAKVRRVRDSASKSFIEITITEGRNRQVRRMVEAAGSRVLKLVRTAIGPVQLGELQMGKTRALTMAEVKAIRASAGKV